MICTYCKCGDHEDCTNRREPEELGTGVGKLLTAIFGPRVTACCCKGTIMSAHCDSSITHRPGTCEFCDRDPGIQEYREIARINFTGENDPDKAPCPSEYFRPAENRDRWGGNIARPTDEVFLEEYQKIRSDLEEGRFLC